MLKSRSSTRRMALMTASGVALLVGGCTTGRVETTTGGDVAAARTVTVRPARSIIATWPAKQQETATLMIDKYGEPSVTGDRMLVWYGTGPFVKTTVSRDEVPHNFPMPHMDYLAQTVKHSVPGDKLDELHDYDGSVWYHRTRGELSAQCDKEEANFLALNLAHDVINGKRTVADARAFYATTMKAFMQGDKSSPYLQGIMFPTEPNAADPDRRHPSM